MSEFAAGEQLSEEATTAQNGNILSKGTPPECAISLTLEEKSIEATIYHLRYPDSYRHHTASLQDGVGNPFDSARSFWSIVEACGPVDLRRSFAKFFESA